MTLCAQYTDNMKKRTLAQNGMKEFAKAGLAATKSVTYAVQAFEIIRSGDAKAIIKHLKRHKPRSRKRGRAIRKLERLMKYPTIIGYGK